MLLGKMTNETFSIIINIIIITNINVLLIINIDTINYIFINLIGKNRLC